jgi:type IV pilus biogenesis protein CpaD/CtpE
MSKWAMGLLALAATLAGCAENDPYQREGVWNVEGSNAANLRAMVADPSDLDMGRDNPLSPGDVAAAAVVRLRADTVRRLPASSISNVHATDTGGAQTQGDAGTPAAPFTGTGTALGASQ